MKVAVTGGTGFIGSNICGKLLEDRCSVVCVDNLSAGNKQNIREFLKHRNFRFKKADILELKSLESAFKGIDYVLHHAAYTSVPGSVKEPIKATRINVMGTLNVLKAAADTGVKKAIFASSSAVYGDSKALPKREDMATSPMSPYALTKVYGEEMGRIFHKLYGLDFISLRYFNVYGPKQDPDSEYAAVIPKFIGMLQKHKRPTIYGDGTQTRDFIFVDDVVQANLKAMKSRKGFGIYNISSGKQTSVNQLAITICNVLGMPLNPVYKKPRKGDIVHSYADITRARKDLGFKPEYNLSAGLKRTIEWFDSSK